MNVNILSSQEAATLQEMIAASQHIVICCHKSPDGDAIGSSLGWRGFLLSQGKQAQVCIPDMMPDYLQWLPDSQTILRYDKHPAEVQRAFDEADLVFCLDFNGAGRLDEMQDVLTGCRARKVMIDHHLAPCMDVDLQISQPHMSSASELVFRIVWQLGGFEQMDRKWAACVYCGMMTDTGAFTYNSASPEVYNVIARLLAKGINKDRIYRNVYWVFSVSRMRLWGDILSRFIVSDDGRASYFTISRKDMKRYNYIKGDAEGLVNMPLQVKGMKLSISLREDTEKPNLVWVSLRSVDDFPCNKMAEQYFNGGGHLNASGGRLYCSLEKAEEIVKRAIKDFKY